MKALYKVGLCVPFFEFVPDPLQTRVHLGGTLGARRHLFCIFLANASSARSTSSVRVSCRRPPWDLAAALYVCFDSVILVLATIICDAERIPTCEQPHDVDEIRRRDRHRD